MPCNPVTLCRVLRNVFFIMTSIADFHSLSNLDLLDLC
jgi:hypothetical protein